MPANRFNGHSDYGVGIGLRIPHYHHIFEKKPVVDWFEIISENFMMDGGRPLHVLDQILEQYRVVQHGVSMYFGSAEPLNREHLRRLKTLVKRTKTPWLTDHLCWVSVDGRYSHDLLPMPYTFEAAKRFRNCTLRNAAARSNCRRSSSIQHVVLAGQRELEITPVLAGTEYCPGGALWIHTQIFDPPSRLGLHPITLDCANRTPAPAMLSSSATKKHVPDFDSPARTK